MEEHVQVTERVVQKLWAFEERHDHGSSHADDGSGYLGHGAPFSDVYSLLPDDELTGYYNFGKIYFVYA